mmetsp:Transcript_22718/g.44575  ORF Transcript_22718/g.44575 Transcript_22718/m.44575 type:complete len:415 (-) Transcript_22718:38-1282(-)
MIKKWECLVLDHVAEDKVNLVLVLGLEDAGDRDVLVKALIGDVLISEGHSLGLLLRGSGSAYPDPDTNVGVEEEDILGLEHVPLNLALVLESHLDGARLVRDAEQLDGISVKSLVLASLILGEGVGGVSRADIIDGATKDRPELVVHNVDLAGLAVAGSNNVALKVSTLALLEGVGVITNPEVDLKAGIKDKHITVVKVGGGNGHLECTGGALGAADHKEAGLVLLGLHIAESRRVAAVEVHDLLEVGLEETALRSLELTVLDGAIVEKVINLDSLVGSNTDLVLGGLVTKPEVHIPGELVSGLARLILGLVGVEHDVRVAHEELANVIVIKTLHAEVRCVSIGTLVLNTPYLKADLGTSATELSVAASSSLAEATVFGRADASNVGVLEGGLANIAVLIATELIDGHCFGLRL